MALTTADDKKSSLNRWPEVIEASDRLEAYERRPQFWHKIDRTLWNSYAWQWANRLTSLDDIASVIELTDADRLSIKALAELFPAQISPHYASLIRHELGASCPIRQQALPQLAELEHGADLLDDPLGEARHAIASCATRRYPDRALLYTTNACAMRCRHCTRRSKVGLPSSPTSAELFDSLDRIVANPQIRDVLISGGDPLSLSTTKLAQILERLRQSRHIDTIRLCSRMPCTLPQRIDADLCDCLKRFAPIYFNTQFNHPFEATVEAEKAFAMLRDAGCILGNQTVLLKGINDCPQTHERLNRWLLRNGCRPYYLFVCDVAQGTQHFRAPIASGLKIIEHLRGRVSGLGIPHYVIDLPDGHGKLELSVDHLVEGAYGGPVVFKNWQGLLVKYNDFSDS